MREGILWRTWSGHRIECPVVFPLGPLLNPLPQGFDFLGGQFLLEFGWGHYIIFILRGDSMPGFAFIQVFDNKSSNAVPFLEGMVLFVQAEVGFA